MARGQAGAAEKQLGQTNVIGADERARQQTLENKLVPGYTNLMDTGFTSPGAEAAATTNIMGAEEAPFEATKFEAANRAGRTGNAADLTAEEDQLAMEEGRAAGSAAGDVQLLKQRGQLAGMSGLGGLRAEDLKAMEDMYGLGPPSLQARAAGQSGDQAALGYLNWGTGGGKSG